MKHKRTPAREFAPGHFSELVAKHNWPPRFVPQMVWNAEEAKRKEAARLGREAAIANGTGWKQGTLVLPGTPKWLAPQDMERVA